MYRHYLADILATIHTGYVAVVVFGLVFILVGHALGWKWVGNRWFRLVHLGMIVGVVLRTLLWDECPLTWWEYDLRGGFAPENFQGTAFGKLMHDVISPDFPLWVFHVVYAAFAALVIATLWVVPVRWKPSQSQAPPPELDAARRSA